MKYIKKYNNYIIKESWSALEVAINHKDRDVINNIIWDKEIILSEDQIRDILRFATKYNHKYLLEGLVKGREYRFMYRDISYCVLVGNIGEILDFMIENGDIDHGELIFNGIPNNDALSDEQKPELFNKLIQYVEDGQIRLSTGVSISMIKNAYKEGNKIRI